MDKNPFKADVGEENGRFSLTPLLAALQFMTVMPAVIKRPFTDQELGRAVGFYPLVGLLLGSCLAGLNALLGLVFPPSVRVALLMFAWILLIGVLHLDGFLDACDGLFGGWNPDKRLEIMRDHRVGAFALAGGVLLLLTKYSALTTSTNITTALILAPVLGRWAITFALVRYPYAREKGMGRTMKDQAGNWELGLGTITAVFVSILLGGLTGIISMIVVFVILLGTIRFVMSRIPGLTGDIYGTVCEISELVVLLIYVAV
ncbi:MAG: adenosylcobinamide-GDP ribazoletransferase [Chloroflexi bacterium]|nr:MAG: adenosylcobinamide-GDP ribazoletransferase [Chloroflexota bacterium]